ncbi:MAG TPA: sigma-70 family RNA polymerase sigma factor [Longimicrobium sp.]|jgi:RNA polymerase sigma factor (sigma-70 family)|uniref:RNA polymerase sigma factor n=1 Tax=Longimicrobium sp. TaxID=2029185 RepID=UPI002ED8B139
MPDRQHYESLFLEHHPRIERIIASLCARKGVRGDEAQEFASWVRERLIADDYAILRKFQGRSSLPTYLTTVIINLFRDFRVARRGRWRPSATAVRRGELAVRLERLVQRDGLRWSEAAEVVRSTGDTEMSPVEITSLIAELPDRSPMRPVQTGADALDMLPASARADAEIIRADAQAERGMLMAALFRAMDRLDPEDRLAVRMRFWDGARIADIARGLGREPRWMYKRIDRVMQGLRSALEAEGVTGDQVADVLGELNP